MYSPNIIAIGPMFLAKKRAVAVACAAPGDSKLPKDVRNNPHRYFDSVTLVAKAGRGGNGSVFLRSVNKNRGRKAKQHKQKGNEEYLPPSGTDGGDVVVVVDSSLDSLLHLHERERYAAGDGKNASPGMLQGRGVDNLTGIDGPRKGKNAVIYVPPGTLIMRKGRRKHAIKEVVYPGDSIVVLKGGAGGQSVWQRSKSSRKKLSATSRQNEMEGVRTVGLDDLSLQPGKGDEGPEAMLEFQLRVVADVALLGFPNAGKSSLLRAMTAAKPEVAPYPFTTLRPNLGVIQPEILRAIDPRWRQVLSSVSPTDDTRGLVIADLPGLLEEAHRGKGLGRMFLRHVRRTRILLHVVDVSSEDPVADFAAVRKELQLYNPEYLTRPHIIALNKMDVLDSRHRDLKDYTECSAFQMLYDKILEGYDSYKEWPPVVPISAKDKVGINNLMEKVVSQLLVASTGLPKKPTAKKDEEGDWDPSWDSIDLDSIP